MSDRTGRRRTVGDPAIDFVVTWVDDSDAVWAGQRDRYAPDARSALEGVSAARFRDWGALRFWFRGVLEFCPWVRRIHLVTTNATPAWLDRDSDRVNVVRHEQIIDPQYLPTFNSRVIELNMHKIPDLAEKFVYFNDDMYPLQRLTPDHFFPGGLPAGVGVQTALSVGDSISHAMLNNLRLINETFDKSQVLKRNPRGWLSPRYGRHLLQNVALMPWPRFTGFYNHHLPIPLLKRSCQLVWREYEEAISLTLESRFRQFTDLNVFLFSYWQLCSGSFVPVAPHKFGRYEQLSPTNSGAAAAAIIRSGSVPVLCLNDGDVESYRETARMIEHAMCEHLPRPSSVETADDA